MKYKKRPPKKEITAEELRQWLKDKRIRLDCKHHHCQHNWSNTMVVHEDGKIDCFS